MEKTILELLPRGERLEKRRRRRRKSGTRDALSHLIWHESGLSGKQVEAGRRKRRAG
jgi:hypothetical protein